MQLVQGPLWFCSVGSVVSGPGSSEPASIPGGGVYSCLFLGAGVTPQVCKITKIRLRREKETP